MGQNQSLGNSNRENKNITSDISTTSTTSTISTTSTTSTEVSSKKDLIVPTFKYILKQRTKNAKNGRYKHFIYIPLKIKTFLSQNPLFVDKNDTLTKITVSVLECANKGQNYMYYEAHLEQGNFHINHPPPPGLNDVLLIRKTLDSYIRSDIYSNWCSMCLLKDEAFYEWVKTGIDELLSLFKKLTDCEVQYTLNDTCGRNISPYSSNYNRSIHSFLRIEITW